MGYISGAAYNMGVCVGLASYHFSLNVMKNTSAGLESLKTAQNFANLLTKQNKFSKTDLVEPFQNNGNRHNSIEIYRQNWESDIRTHSNTAANAYRLGLLMGIAEGQATSSNWKYALKFAHDSLKSAKVIMLNNFGMVGFNYSLINNAINLSENFGAGAKNTYAVIQPCRIKYYDTINMAGGVE